MKRLTVVCLLAAITLFSTGCKEEVKKAEAIRPVRVVEISGAMDKESRTFPGKVKATQEASLAFRVSGEVVRLEVKEGDRVEKGQLIAQLDQRDYLAAIADYEARLVGARSVLKEARLNIERNRKLLEDKIIAQSAFDTAQSTYETSRAEVLSLEQSLRRARLNLQYTRLTAPFSGFIATKDISNHEFIQAKEEIVTLADTSALDVVMDVPESVWLRGFNSGVGEMPEAHVRFESLPGKVFPVQVKEFQTTANSETQTYQVTMTMDNTEDSGVHPGMTAEVVGNMPDNGDNSVAIPFSSVVGEVEGKKFVWVLNKDNSVQKREIEIGRIMKDMFQASKGVQPGDVIVVAGVNYLREGQKVKVLKGRIGGRE
ncbi:efflux RND transporter periplasmic adaptor subunit [Pseudodesulfovibrio sp. zrk46]|uniref:efflux RND transporter periplasmic adaptor subunit n=1 Tax=Pseudodesulfovibrio sp. zrk46 TaxID=2725288 RepID=UPI001449A283|nr:efflux RND transporter periplasmic adaptor subunit [Pseudodesulfovibrio sp. zrk46]QJB56740.1 efflux RND transporter periplasmic adaptor subunit [Pseudodesulfovibrio sp. zrk46]